MIFDFFKKNKSRNFTLKINNQNSIFNEWAQAKNAEGFFSVMDRLPNPDKILRKTGKNISVYRSLLNHYQIGACIEQRIAGTKGCSWSLKENGCNKEHYKLYDEIFKNTDILSLISNILTAPLFGYTPIEIIYEKSGSYILPVKYSAKPQEWFYFNAEGEFFFKDKTSGGKRKIDFENDVKFLLPRNNPDFLNPYGAAVLSRCFWNAAFIDGGMEFWIKFAEKYGMPYLFGKYDRSMSDKEKEEMMHALENMVQDAIAVIPNDGSIDIMQTGSSGSAAIYESIVTKCENNIAKAVLGQTLTTEIGQGGSYAAAKTHSEVRADIINSDKQLVSKTLNQLIKFINILNFNDDIMPVFEFETPEDLNTEKAERDNKVGSLGVKFTKQYICRTYGYQEDDIEIIEKNNFGMEFADSPSGQMLKQVQHDKNINNDFELLDSLAEVKEFEKILAPEIDKAVKFFMKTSSAEETLEKLAELYPEFDTKQLEDTLAKVIFTADILGRLSAQNG